MTRARYCFAGSLTVDNVLTSAGEVLPSTAAGNAVYSAVGASVWDGHVAILSRVGRGYPAAALSALAADGVCLEGVRRLHEQHGMNVAFWYKPDGSRQRTIGLAGRRLIPESEWPRFVDYTTKGAEHRYRTALRFSPSPSDVSANYLDDFSGMHLAAMPVQRHEALIAFARRTRRDLILTLDSPWYDERDLEEDHHSRILSLVDALLPSQADLRPPLPVEDPLTAAAMLILWGSPRVVIKLGRGGCLVVDQRRRGWLVPSYPTDPVDLTGAGDAFCGGFIVGLTTSRDIVKAAAMGTVSASLVIENVGFAGIAKAVGSAELARRLDETLAGVRSVGDPEIGAAFGAGTAILEKQPGGP